MKIQDSQVVYFCKFREGLSPPDGDHVGHALHEAPQSEESHTGAGPLPAYVWSYKGKQPNELIVEQWI